MEKEREGERQRKDVGGDNNIKRIHEQNMCSGRYMVLLRAHRSSFKFVQDQYKTQQFCTMDEEIYN